MLFITLEDLTDKIEVVVFASALEKAPATFVENKVVFVYGRLDLRDGETKLVADRVEEITDNADTPRPEFSFNNSPSPERPDKFLF